MGCGFDMVCIKEQCIFFDPDDGERLLLLFECGSPLLATFFVKPRIRIPRISTSGSFWKNSWVVLVFMALHRLVSCVWNRICTSCMI
mmetsp:Transcript_12210/g.28166  ORF Transcript_12210/g.28166 Transcript_12210/m.28166 type:complete len:87 (-) Transcript_12210:9-269(-)|eukprot:768101-Hanusia_phi.AAC.5